MLNVVYICFSFNQKKKDCYFKVKIIKVLPNSIYKHGSILLVVLFDPLKFITY